MEPNILLVKPSFIVSKSRIASATGTPSSGVAYIAAFLRERGIQVSILDAFGECPLVKTACGDHIIYGLTNEQVIERIPEDVNIVGVSCMFSNEWFYHKELISQIKRKLPRAIVVLGGEHATALAEYIMESCGDLDFLIMGEGELAFYRLVQSLFSKAVKREEIAGLVYRQDRKIRVNPKGPRDRIHYLDKLPFPAWDLTPMHNYLNEGLAAISSKGKRIVPILASRGCPFHCKFCSNDVMWGTPYVLRDYREVIRELAFYQEEYGITGFEFQDITLIMKKDWMINFCKALINEGITLEWNIPTTRSEAIDEEMVTNLKEAGCTNATLSPDSGSVFQLKDMDKKVDLGRVTEVVKLLARSGFIIKVSLVIGFPNERHCDVLRSLLYGLRMAFLGVGSVIFYRFVPYPGSRYFRELQKGGKLPRYGPEFDRFLSINTYNELGKVYSFSKHISSLMIKFYMFLGYFFCSLAYFLGHPGQIFKAIKRIRENRGESVIENLIISLLEFLKLKKSYRAKAG